MAGDTGGVLLVTHEATRTGAPRVALEVARALHDRHLTTVARAGGPLARDFAAASDAFRREPLPRLRVLLRRARLGGLANRLEEAVARWVLHRARPDAVVLNTVVTACYVRPALRRGIRPVLYVHELGSEVDAAVRRYHLGPVLDRVTLVACSTSVRERLVAATGCPADDVVVLTSPVDVDAVARAADGVEPDPAVPVVAACGPANDTKGADLWLEVAAAVRAARPDRPVRFLWIGRRRQELAVDAIARRLGVDDLVDFVGEVDDPHPRIAASTVFTLTSRRDAFPLVVMEAMALARPVVAFDVGGVPDQLGDAGVVVGAGDVEKLAAAVVQLLDDPDERRRLGEAAAARARRLHDVGPFRDRVRALLDPLGMASTVI